MSDPQDEFGARFNDRRPDEDTEGDDRDNSRNTNNTGNTGSTPGPDPDADATRDRRQIPMYLPEEKADLLNALYERLDGRSKVAGDGGIKKHADFMEELVDFAVKHEDELAGRLGIEHEHHP